MNNDISSEIKAEYIAKHIINMRIKKSNPINLPSIHALLYYIQGYNVAKNKIAFKEEIIADSRGPIVKEVQEALLQYFESPIVDNQEIPSRFKKSVIDVSKRIIDLTIDFSNEDIQSKIWKEGPLLITFYGNPISIGLLRSEFVNTNFDKYFERKQ